MFQPKPSFHSHLMSPQQTHNTFPRCFPVVKSRHNMTLRDWDHAHPARAWNAWNLILLHPHSSNPQRSVVFHRRFLNNINPRRLAHSSRVPEQSGLSNRNVIGIGNPLSAQSLEKKMPGDVNSAKISQRLALCSNLLSSWWILITVSNLPLHTGLLTLVHGALYLFWGFLKRTYKAPFFPMSCCY